MGCRGIEAEAAMLGQPIPILTPEVVGFKLTGALRPGVANGFSTDSYKNAKELGVVGKFVEFYGEGASNLSLAGRCPVANMGPEYGATVGSLLLTKKPLNT